MGLSDISSQSTGVETRLDNSALEARLNAYAKWIRITGIGASVLLVAGATVAGWGVYWFGHSSEKLNQLGGFLAGSTGALWSAAGLFLIFAAFLGQLRQAANQEEEIRLNRLALLQTQHELRGQKEQLAEQSRTFRQQRFENTFFQLLGLHHQIVNNIDRTETPFSFRSLTGNQPAEPSREYRGRDVFVLIYRDLQQSYASFKKAHGEPSLDVAVDEVYVTLYEHNQSDLGHYFRNLYTLVKFVHRSGVDDPHTYTNIVRAQLSSHELLLLFYNGLSKYGVVKFKPLIEEYGLLKNMPGEKLLEETHAAGYQPGALAIEREPLNSRGHD